MRHSSSPRQTKSTVTRRIAFLLRELETRWEIEPEHTYAGGIREDMSIDHCLHSLFGVSKAAADLMVQEYGRYFGLKTACFRGGCLTGPHHSGDSAARFPCISDEVHSDRYAATPFLVTRVSRFETTSTAQISSAHFTSSSSHRGVGEVYNIGGGRHSNASMLEAIQECQELSGRELDWQYSDVNRIGDHMWWISDNGKFAGHYPEWQSAVRS